MKNKIKIIDEIVKRHPAYGVDKGWSYYVGGMKDTGDWYYRKMIDVPLIELKSFLYEIVEQENKPKKELTEQELIDSKILHKTEYGWETELHRKQGKMFDKMFEQKLYNYSIGIDPYDENYITSQGSINIT
jgi:hypothetical protein